MFLFFSPKLVCDFVVVNARFIDLLENCGDSKILIHQKKQCWHTKQF